MATGTAEGTKTPSARSSRRVGGGALSAAGLIAMTVVGLGFLALVSVLGAGAVVADGGETDQAKPSLFCPLHVSTIDWSGPVVTIEASTHD